MRGTKSTCTCNFPPWGFCKKVPLLHLMVKMLFQLPGVIIESQTTILIITPELPVLAFGIL
jgi:hypothetical protein